ncbi:MAG: type II toxin-antitoxin system ParD family antitoxin [Alphaproteobacteria bacterium]|nr:type II toxin-antitoxin system ParD family antitoxin [Alphaproteobacteria bacterium]MCW5743496.1 type II toxin-antitoxin system ParD family antitoxin [Alphaproteobacteria bacterium]
MRTTRSLSVTLPNEMADMIRRKVESGEYASESEVIRDGLRALRQRDAAMERWLREEVVPAYDATMADPSKRIPAEKAFGEAAARYAARKRAAKRR